jgi:hypothetical protein
MPLRDVSKDMVKIDAENQRLRYGADSGGNDLWLQGDHFNPVQVNLPNVRGVMNKISEFFSELE